MKTFLKFSCILLLTAWAGSTAALAQTTKPSTNAAATTAAKPSLSKRYSGKIASVDAQAKSVTLQNATKDEIQVTSKTKITLKKQPAVFDSLVAGQDVSGMKKQNSATGKWEASTLNVGEPRKMANDPAAK